MNKSNNKSSKKRRHNGSVVGQWSRNREVPGSKPSQCIDSHYQVSWLFTYKHIHAFLAVRSNNHHQTNNKYDTLGTEKANF